MLVKGSELGFTEKGKARERLRGEKGAQEDFICTNKYKKRNLHMERDCECQG